MGILCCSPGLMGLCVSPEACLSESFVDARFLGALLPGIGIPPGGPNMPAMPMPPLILAMRCLNSSRFLVSSSMESSSSSSSACC